MLNIFLQRYAQFVRPYLSGLVPAEHRPMAALKVVHTMRVTAEMKRLGERIGLEGEPLFLARLAGLFHDIGRFEQLRRYGTFEDAVSVDHALLSADTVISERLLLGISTEGCETVLSAIRRHNMKSVPPASRWLESVLTLLLRDADKLDIWRVFNDHYSSRGSRGSHRDDSTLELGRPNTPGISGRVRDDIMSGRIVDIANVKNRNDFALARLAWVFDINFVPTLKEIDRRGYISALRGFLPDFPHKEELFARVEGYVKEMIARQTSPC